MNYLERVGHLQDIYDSLHIVDRQETLCTIALDDQHGKGDTSADSWGIIQVLYYRSRHAMLLIIHSSPLDLLVRVILPCRPYNFRIYY